MSDMEKRLQTSSRRSFLSHMGGGLAGLAAGALLQRDGIARPVASSNVDQRASAPRAKSVIWLFMVGGASHMETFDPKPQLTRYHGKTIADTPLKEVLDSPFLDENARDVFGRDRKIFQKVYATQVGFAKYGQSGMDVSDWLPNIARHADDLAVVRSMWTTDVDHGAQLQFHTGRHKLDGVFPTIGSWIHYGLGALNENLPQFVAMGQGVAECCGGTLAHGASYLGEEHAAVPLEVGQSQPLAFASPGKDVFVEEQRGEFELLTRLNRISAASFPMDPAVRARIKSYELAYRMQTAVPRLLKFEQESAATHQLYGLDRAVTRPFGQICLAARRMVEQGVRFVQAYHGGNGGAGRWDSHKNLRTSHSTVCGQVDVPIAGLLQDLKQRGLLEETLVVWATEFGRSPGAQGGNGRDHHPFGFSVWLAGGGIQGGVVHGATDELGFHAVENRHYVTDIHATVLHQLGLDARQLEIPGHKRLEMDFGHPIQAIL